MLNEGALRVTTIKLLLLNVNNLRHPSPIRYHVIIVIIKAITKHYSPLFQKILQILIRIFPFLPVL